MCQKGPVQGLIEKIRDFFVDVLYYWLIVMFLSVLLLPFGGLFLLVQHVVSVKSLFGLVNEWMCFSVAVTAVIFSIVLMLTAMGKLLEGCMDKTSRLLVLVILGLPIYELYLVFTVFTSINCCFTPGC